MGVRTNSEITFQIGRDNALTDKLLDEGLSSLLDTLDHATVHEATLAAGESNYLVPFGDVTQGRLVYIRANGAIRVTPGGGLATSAQVDGSGGSYPTGFTGGETLDIDIDNGGTITVTFDAADQLLPAVINRINAATALAGVVDGGGNPATVARDNGSGELRLLSSTTGVSSEVEVIAGGTALGTLGLSATVVNGVNASAGQTPITLTKPANTSGSDAAATVPVFFFATLQTSALTIDNLETAAETRLTVAVAGDVVTTPPTTC